MRLDGLQTYAPAQADFYGDGCVPPEIFVDFRCESPSFDRLIPQTDATIQYDKFNRLRLRNNVTSIAKASATKGATLGDDHLQNQTV